MGGKLEAGTVIAGRYRLDEPLGEGGYGAVWRATQLNLDRRVAIKFLKAFFDDGAKRRFDREARALGRLQHPSCVQMLDFGFDGQAFLVTEFLGGERLDEWLQTEPMLEERLLVAAQVLEALGHAHQQNIIHRDLKPPNILVTRTPDGGLLAKVLDFGIASVVGEKRGDITKTGEVFGTPGFMSPEQLRGDESVGPPSDLYAFGVLLYQMLEGRPPFAGGTPMYVALRHLAEPAPRVTAPVPPPLPEIVARLLEKEPTARYPNASGVLRALGEVELARPTIPRPAVPPRAWSAPAPLPVPATTERNATNPWLGLAALVVVAVVLTVGIAVALVRPSGGDEPVPVLPTALMRTSAKPTAPPSPLPAPTPLGVPEARPDAGAEPDARTGPTVPGSAGCAEDFDGHGLQKLSAVDALMDSRSVVAYVPKGYRPRSTHALVLLLHDTMQSAVEVLRESGFDELADANGFIVVLPADDTFVFPWSSKASLARAQQGVELAQELLCVDPKRVFVYGHGAGGRGAESLRCLLPDIAAMATSSHRLSVQHSPCWADVPYLHIGATEDGRDPFNGGVGCLGGSEMRSLAANEATYVEIHRCTGERRVAARHERSRCYTWECEVPFMSCHVDGGRPLPGAEPHAPCEGPAPTFDYPKKVWEFFETHSGASP